MENKTQSNSVFEVLVFAIIVVVLAIPAAQWLKRQIETKVTADQSVAQSLEEISAYVRNKGGIKSQEIVEWKKIQGQKSQRH